jgi:hypothetical protein
MHSESQSSSGKRGVYAAIANDNDVSEHRVYMLEDTITSESK